MQNILWLASVFKLQSHVPLRHSLNIDWFISPILLWSNVCYTAKHNTHNSNQFIDWTREIEKYHLHTWQTMFLLLDKMWNWKMCVCVSLRLTWWTLFEQINLKIFGFLHQGNSSSAFYLLLSSVYFSFFFAYDTYSKYWCRTFPR